MNTNRIANALSKFDFVHTHVGFQIFATKLTNEFSHGVIYLTREITAMEKLEVIDAINELFNGEVASQRYGKNLVIWNENKFSRVSHIKGAFEFKK